MPRRRCLRTRPDSCAPEAGRTLTGRRALPPRLGVPAMTRDVAPEIRFDWLREAAHRAARGGFRRGQGHSAASPRWPTRRGRGAAPALHPPVADGACRLAAADIDYDQVSRTAILGQRPSHWRRAASPSSRPAAPTSPSRARRCARSPSSARRAALCRCRRRRPLAADRRRPGAADYRGLIAVGRDGGCAVQRSSPASSPASSSRCRPPSATASRRTARRPCPRPLRPAHRAW